MTLTLAEARAADITALGDLILTHGPNPWNWLPPDEVAAHLAQIATGEVGGMLAKENGLLVGAVTFRMTSHFARYQSVDHPQGYVCEAVVHRDHACKGIGSRLLTAAIEALAARGASEVYIDRHEENAASAGMMRKAGFVEVQTFAEPARRPNGSGRTTVSRVRLG